MDRSSADTFPECAAGKVMYIVAACVSRSSFPILQNSTGTVMFRITPHTLIFCQPLRNYARQRSLVTVLLMAEAWSRHCAVKPGLMNGPCFSIGHENFLKSITISACRKA